MLILLVILSSPERVNLKSLHYRNDTPFPSQLYRRRNQTPLSMKVSVSDFVDEIRSVEFLTSEKISDPK